jgi:hypothetical protein
MARCVDTCSNDVLHLTVLTLEGPYGLTYAVD